MNNHLASLVLLISSSLSFGVAVAGCAAESSEPAAAADAEELRSSATAFFSRDPLTGRRTEALRRELLRADEETWIRTEGSAFGMQWESKSSGPLSAAARADLVQAAFTFHLREGDPSVTNRKHISKLSPVAPTAAALDKALDAVGFIEAAENVSTKAARSRLAEALGAAARTTGITIYSGSANVQVDVDWEGVLVVVDEPNKQLLFARGAYGH